MAKPRVITKCVANTYAGRDERIIEFSSDAGGGLISFRLVNGALNINLYRVDGSVIVAFDGADLGAQAER